MGIEEKKRDCWGRWLLGLLFITGVVYGQIKELPAKVSKHHDRISKLEYTSTSMKEDLTEIKGDIKILLRRRRGR